MKTLALRTEIQTVLGRYAQEGLFSGAAVGFYSPKKGIAEEIYFSCPPHTLFDLASLTKCLVTAPLLAQGELTGLWRSDSRILEIPELRFLAEIASDRWKTSLADKTLQDLIGHHSSLPAWHNFWIGSDFTHLPSDWQNRARRIREIFARILSYRVPHEEPAYSDVGYIALGLLLELRGQESLALQFNRLLTELGLRTPLLMGYPQSLAAENLAQSLTTGYCALRGRSLVGEVHDENACALGGVTGHAGLFADLGSLSTYFQAMIASPLGTFLCEKSRDLLAKGESYAYGFHPMNGEFSRVFAGGSALGHLGFTGTGLWYDPSRNLTILILCNRTYQKRRDDRIRPFRQEILRIGERFATCM